MTNVMTKPIQTAIFPQKLAAAPNVSAWVSASAGTGKTKVLTDRLLNLMLTGQDPAKILCLTFTKAAAAEMQTRLFQRLSEWVQMSDDHLHHSLEQLWQDQVTSELKARARCLFTQILDLPGGIKIQTIHGFCQTILSRFPLEAQIPPQFSVIDEMTASRLLRQATARVLRTMAQSNSDLLGLLALHFKDQKFEEALGELLSHRRDLKHLSHFTLDSYAQHLQTTLDLPAHMEVCCPKARDQFILQACQDHLFDRDGLQQCLQLKHHPLLEQWLCCSAESRVQLYEAYARLFLTADGCISKRPAVKHDQEAERIWRLNDSLNRLEIAQKSLILFCFGSAIYDCYQEQKTAEAALDYDDLIEKTIELLTDPSLAAWVLYKLDGGIDHILIDEAQDTNPAQWEVVKALTQDFFRPDKIYRTLFVVGDSKQSIYSFQGANPNDFIQLRHYFAQQTQAIGQTWRSVDLSVSFRSAPEILDLVDRVFADPEMHAKVLADANVIHVPFRQEQQGKVSLWPTVVKEESKEKSELTPWTLLLTRQEDTSIEQRCAAHIAQQIKHLLHSQVVLASTNKPIQPKDILILVRQRSSFICQLIRQLKQYHIPVAGADRFLLNDHLAVKDLLCLGQFLLQPGDDLSLATVLTSPLIGMNHEDLLHLCLDRQGSLWSELIRHGTHPTYQDAYLWLKTILDKTDYLSPFELFSFILYELEGKKRLISRLSLEAEDVITEFMSLLFNLERKVSPSLELILGEILSQNHELKRDSAATSHNEVRLMTIHGSKGLQAPVVILIEKFSSRTPTADVLWQHDAAGKCILLLAQPPKAQDIELTRQLKAATLCKDEAEDKRLLYVALTRAQDHLYVCGYGDKVSKDSWYNLLETKGVQTEAWQIPEGTLQMSCLAADGHFSDANHLPDFFTVPANLSCQLAPIKDKEPVSAKAHRGIIIHKLLEMLACVLPEHRPTAGLHCVNQLTSDCLLQRDCLETALKILGDPDLQEFFSENAVAELEIMTCNGELVRLDNVVLGSPIKILDFKSAEYPPASAEHVPARIRQQLADYREALATLYPSTPIECYVLWTTNGRLDQIHLH
ncbi:UvrD-helicase domain-containing protein [Candidatus Odyssella thessalonicensis]|uniref:UvrD-helicase domain-containing protein n=1 Tax=Candidatus Odyssella thessalonicensis TaxID=84647 RepID=UPI000225ABDE|nr:UvrD-helicase domain-containing protein [Candidatus Odyssella thessalonicensis]